MPDARAIVLVSRLGPLALGLAAACGQSSTRTASAPAPVVIATPPLTPDDAPVARVAVNRPQLIDSLRRARLLSPESCATRAAATEDRVTITVWASCVAAQARTIAAGTVDDRRRAALEQCEAFELLAQVAEACGLAAAPEVADAMRTAEVNRLIETDFEQRYHAPADLAPQIDLMLKANPWILHIVELRGSSFSRFVVPKGAPAAVEAEAHALADRLAAEMAGQTGLFGVNVADAARRIARGSAIKLESSDFRPAHHDDLVDAYAAALFAIPEVGRASPAFRSPWGWDVVVWTGGNEARERSRDEVVAELFPEARRRQFPLWANQIAKQLGVHIEVDAAAVARLDSGAEPPRAPPAPGGLR